ncbi:MAG: transcription-repair coupling factor [bacterium]
MLNHIIATLKTNLKGTIIQGIWGAGAAFITSQIYQHIQRPLLIICANEDSADIFFQDLSFFHKGEADSLNIFPQWEILPYEPLSEDIEISEQRLATLYRISGTSLPIVITTIEAYMKRILPRETLLKNILIYNIGDTIVREDLARYLLRLGYRQTDMVETMGEFTMRGDIIDLFPPLTDLPYRLELWGDELEGIKTFDITSQRSRQKIEAIKILPLREVLLDDASRQRLLSLLRDAPEEGYYQEAFNSLEQGSLFPGVEQFLGLIYPQADSLLDYLPKETLIIFNELDKVKEKIKEFKTEIEENFSYLNQRGRLYPTPDKNYDLDFNADNILNNISSVAFETLKYQEVSSQDIFQLSLKSSREIKVQADLEERKGSRFLPIINQIKRLQEEKYLVFLITHNKGQAQRLQELLHEYEIANRFHANKCFPDLYPNDLEISSIIICLGSITNGFLFPEHKLAIVSEEDLFGEKKKETQRKVAKSGRHLVSLSDLKINDYIVHIEHGIGIYRGLKKMTVADLSKDFLILEYADQDKIYVPVEKINLVEKFLGSGGVAPRINKLGSKAWEQAKAKAKKAVEEIAGELIKLYASRKVAESFTFSPDNNWQREFEDSFEYEETPDQHQAIIEVKQDMECPKPMDRLLCGDVGYGKTEVAMRAAFKAVMDNKQVAILVPTTILAQQHYQTFSQRFAPFPVTIEVLSRFKSPKEQKKITKKLREGVVDIIIGTHRLLQSDIAFKDIGLLIVDEEQRFGVTHKEKLKKLKHGVDILTMTATPIPRTLHMSLSGIKDISVIETPPQNRLSIVTSLIRLDEHILKEAISRELERGGQTFFVHNRVENIESMATFIQKIIPNIRIAVAHGQMDGHSLEKIMLNFLNKKYDLLLATTIIESGLDMPNVNTIIINRADRFGLAQIYQLRGRVGRSKHRAYAYLIVPPERSLTDDARKRLQAIQELSELGSGFRLAAFDLEIRGAGNLLGREQHGNICAVGFDLYCQLLEDMVMELNGTPKEETFEVTVDLRFNAYIPEDYISDVNQKLTTYKRLASITSLEELKNIRAELGDRYGTIPSPAESLLQTVEIRILALNLKIQEIRRKNNQIVFNFPEKTDVNLEKLIGVLKRYFTDFRFTPENSLVIKIDSHNQNQIYEKVKNFLQQL